jgi:hypothetical protein
MQSPSSLPHATICGLVVAIGAWSAPIQGQGPGVLTYQNDIRPLLEAKCFRCHGEAKQSAGLDLRDKASLFKGGETGPAVIAGSSEKSLLFEQIHKHKMPPGTNEKLTDTQVALVKKWIDSGAHGDLTSNLADASTDKLVTESDRQFWSFRPPVRPAVPPVKDSDRARNPIDAFVLAKLEVRGLTTSPSLDRPALLRRAKFDLLGLPPTPEEIDAFLTDEATDAYERLVDRLLASPEYGERWGRHWLDAAGYADSDGYLDADRVRPDAWRYRDYVIRAFNADKPYDRFLLEQIAGDELQDWKKLETLTPDAVDNLLATGFLRTAPDPTWGQYRDLRESWEVLDNQTTILVSSTLGLTIQCARCHSHKFDPIPQRDYYRVRALLHAAYRPGPDWPVSHDRNIVMATAKEEQAVKEHNAKIDQKVAELRTAHRDECTTLVRESLPFAMRLNGLGIQAPAVAIFGARTAIAARQLAIAEQTEGAKKRTLPLIRGLTDMSPTGPTDFLFRRGNFETPGEAVQPGVLNVLDRGKPFAVAPLGHSTGRRKAFAEWLVQPDNPLTARVLVNRLWQHHFGSGLVSTPENFGTMGSPPTHPELLDWLATEFIRQGWSIKAMHRLIMTSHAYRQGATADPRYVDRAKQIDPDNKLLWRRLPVRIEGEIVRDAVLAVSGALDAGMSGPAQPVEMRGDGQVVAPSRRRSVYLINRRSQPLTLLNTFDTPVMELNCLQRPSSVVVSQALELLNSQFLLEQSDRFAERLRHDAATTPARIDRAFHLAFGRAPNKDELVTITNFLAAQTARRRTAGAGERAERLALADVCQMLFCANEFIYVD